MVVRAGQGLHGTANQSSAFKINQSLRFNDDDTAHFDRTPSSVGNRQTWTYSVWVKGSDFSGDANTVLSGGNYAYGTYLWFRDGGHVAFGRYYSGSYTFLVEAQGFYRDPSAWYHLVFTYDSTQATASNRVKLYVNGEQITSFTTESYPSLNFEPDINNDSIHWIGERGYDSALKLHGYLAEVHLVDGTALDASYFGFTDPLTNTWRPKKYEGTYGTNGFYLDFSDSSDLGADRSGNGNNWTPNNFEVNDVVPDSPSGVTFSTAPTSGITTNNSGPSNYATWNILEGYRAGTVTNGNLDISNSDYLLQKATIHFGGGGPTTGKYYWEATYTGGDFAMYGGVTSNFEQDPGEIAGQANKSFFGGGPYVRKAYTATSTTSTGVSYSSGGIVGFAIDLDAQTIAYYLNNTLRYTDTTLPDPATTEIAPFVFTTASGVDSWADSVWNFGQKDFAYTPPSGYLPLCSANLSSPASEAAARPDKYVGIHTYVGTGSEHDIPNAFGFNPDFLWTRRSDASGDRHNWYDKVRGDDGTRMYVICPDATSSQATRTEATTAVVKSSSWPRHGFRVGTNGQTNSSGALYTAFGLKAGGAPVSNSDGSITTQVSASPESGFSIIGYTGNLTTGASIGHGLNQAPEMLIFKSLSEDRNWLIWHKDLNAGAGDYYLYFSAAKRAQDTRTDRPLKDSGCTTATTIILGQDSEVNHNAAMICYAFHSVPGVVKVGTYLGNGDTTDGPFCYTGFRPKFVIAKNFAGGLETNWFVKDAENSKYNQMGFTLYLNTSDARVNNFPIDFYSNGFKLKDDNALINEDGSDYCYIAFAETPTNNLFGGQANAR